MQAQEVLSQLQAAGVAVSLQEDGRLRVLSPEPLTDTSRALIRHHKAALMAWLSRPADTPEEDAGAWTPPEVDTGAPEPPEDPPVHPAHFLATARRLYGLRVSLAPDGTLALQADAEPPGFVVDAINDAAPWLKRWLRVEAALGCSVLRGWLREWLPEHEAGRATTNPRERWTRYADHAALEGVDASNIAPLEVFEDTFAEVLAQHSGDDSRVGTPDAGDWRNRETSPLPEFSHSVKKEAPGRVVA